MDQFQEILTTIKDLQRRVIALESYSQVQKLIFKDNTNTPRILIDGINGIMKASRAGFDVTTTPNVNLVFNSNFSMFREVQMQVNPDHEFTSNSSWLDLLDAQIQLNFTDWTDTNMYYEVVMKAGVGTTAHARLYNMTTSSQLVDISTTATTAVSVRSSSLTKPSGVNNFNESIYNDPGGPPSGSNFTDIYIGRVIMRYDF